MKNSEKVRLCIMVSGKELDLLEDLVTSWNLCKKHHGKLANDMSEQQLFKMQDNCKDCQAEVRKRVRASLSIWSRLVHEHNVVSDGKCYGCDMPNITRGK